MSGSWVQVKSPDELNRTFVRFKKFKAHVRLSSVAHYSVPILLNYHTRKMAENQGEEDIHASGVDWESEWHPDEELTQSRKCRLKKEITVWLVAS